MKGLDAASQILRLKLDGQPPSKHLAVKANGACVQQTHKSTARKQFLRQFTIAIPAELNTEGTGKNAHLPAFPIKGLICILYKLLPEGQASIISTYLGTSWDLPQRLRKQHIAPSPSPSSLPQR